MAAAATQVLDDMTQRMGRQRAMDAYDRMSTGMANTYGQGHPWLGCAELKRAAADLVEQSGRTALLASADRLLAPVPAGPQLAQR